MASLSFNKILSKALETVTHGYLSFDAISSGVLRVDLGESAFGPSPKVLHKLKNLSQNISEYPIKQTVVLQHALSKKFQISRDQILVSWCVLVHTSYNLKLKWTNTTNLAECNNI